MRTEYIKLACIMFALAIIAALFGLSNLCPLIFHPAIEVVVGALIVLGFGSLALSLSDKDIVE